MWRISPQNRNTTWNPLLNRPSEYKPPGGLYLEFALEYKVKQSKNGKFSLLQASPTVHKPLRIQAPPKISPSKRAFEKYKPGGLFSEFYGILLGGVLLIAKTISVEQNKRKFRHPPPPPHPPTENKKRNKHSANKMKSFINLVLHLLLSKLL